MTSHKNSSLKIFIILLFFQSCHSQNNGFAANPSAPFYKVTIDEDNIRLVKVEAILTAVMDTLYMSQSEFSPLKDGYATFVHNLQAYDNKGNSISLTSVGPGIWRVGAHSSSAIQLKYEVNIGHDGVQWSTSFAFARAYTVDNVLFFAGRTVFIAAKGSSTSAIKVQYILPKDWDIVTPYTELASDSYTFEAKDLTELWGNGNFAGRFVKDEINVGKLKVIIAGTPSMQEGVKLFKSALAKIVRAYSSEMGGAPEGKLVIMGSVSQLPAGGETFAKSISLAFSRPPDMANKALWGYLLAHEIFHLWNGHAIAAADQWRVEWFVEGFTEYMSKLTACRTGFITQAEFFEQLAYSHDNYLSAARNISMVNAGLEKGKNFGLIYNGGMSVAFALDAELRKATQNKKGFIDLMRLMYSKFGKTGQPYSYEDIVKVSTELAGEDLSGFFYSYVAGLQVIPLDKYLTNAGLTARNQNDGTVIQANTNASPDEKAMLESVLSQ